MTFFNYKLIFLLHTQSREVNKYHKTIKAPVLWPNSPNLLVKYTIFLKE